MFVILNTFLINLIITQIKYLTKDFMPLLMHRVFANPKIKYTILLLYYFRFNLICNIFIQLTAYYI